MYIESVVFLCPLSLLYILSVPTCLLAFDLHISFTFTSLALSYSFSHFALFHITRYHAHFCLRPCSTYPRPLLFSSPKLTDSKSCVLSPVLLHYFFSTPSLSNVHNIFFCLPAVHRYQKSTLQSKCM